MDQRAEETSDRTDSWCYCSLEGKGRIVLGQGEQGKAEARGAEGETGLGWSAQSHPCSQLVLASICLGTCPLPLCAHPQEAERDLSWMICKAS